MDDLSNYEKLRADAQQFYNGIRPMFSPALNESVYFTAEGFN
jgi:hypothetical protein